MSPAPLEETAARPFGFATAGRLRFGSGVSREAAAAVAGVRVLVVTGGNPDRHGWLFTALAEAGSAAAVHAVGGEPDVATILAGVETCRRHDTAWVIGIGGGSAIDAAKAIAALTANAGDPLRYLEVVGEGRPLEQTPLPVIAIPTTAGTGAEVTRNAVLLVPEHRRKVSLRHDRMLPRLALVDPDLTLSAPPGVTAATGLDALTQCIEPYLCAQPNPLTDALCREGIARAAHALPRVLATPLNRAARSDMMLASLIGGMALANAGLGAVHGFAGPLGGWTGAPHGALCGRLLPAVLRANAAALRARDARHPALGRFAEVANLLTGQPDVEGAIAWIETILEAAAVPRLEAVGLERTDLGRIVQEARASSSMRGNPVELTAEEAQAALEEAS